MLVIITPVKNEGKKLLEVANQLITQTRVPDFWIIVDDNSEDVTPNIIQELEKKYAFIQGVSLSKDSAYDQVHKYGHVVQKGFNDAMRCCKEITFLGVLDADIKLKKNYYEEVITAFNKVPQLGVASGLYLESKNSILNSELGTDRTPRVCGAAMIFRKECFTNIGGFPTCPRPDTVALLKAANRGWKIGVVSSTYALHLRVNQSFTKYLKLGIASYSMDYHPVNALLTGPLLTLKSLSLSPFGFTIGYILGSMSAIKICDDEVKQYYQQSFIRRISKLTSLLSHENTHPNPIETSLIKL